MMKFNYDLHLTEFFFKVQTCLCLVDRKNVIKTINFTEGDK